MSLYSDRIREAEGNVMVMVHLGRLHVCDDELEYPNRERFIERRAGCLHGGLILCPPRLYELYTEYSIQNSDVDGFMAGMVSEWIGDIENWDHVMAINKGTIGAELVPYIHRWMYEVWSKGRSGGTEHLPVDLSLL